MHRILLFLQSRWLIQYVQVSLMLPLTYSFSFFCINTSFALLCGLPVSPCDLQHCIASSWSHICIGPSCHLHLARCRRQHSWHPTRHCSVGPQQDLRDEVGYFVDGPYCVFQMSAFIAIAKTHPPVSAVVAAAAPTVAFLSQTQQAGPGWWRR